MLTSKLVDIATIAAALVGIIHAISGSKPISIKTPAPSVPSAHRWELGLIESQLI